MCRKVRSTLTHSRPCPYECTITNGSPYERCKIRKRRTWALGGTVQCNSIYPHSTDLLGSPTCEQEPNRSLSRLDSLG